MAGQAEHGLVEGGLVEGGSRPVELVYRPTARDIGEAMKARGRVGRRKTWLGAGLLFVLLFAALAGLFAAMGSPAPLVVAASGTVAGALAGAAAASVTRRVQARALQRFAEAQGEFRTTVDSTGIRITGTGTESVIAWELYPRYVETADLFVALSRDASAVGVAILPKRGARDTADVDRLRAILDRSIERAVP